MSSAVQLVSGDDLQTTISKSGSNKLVVIDFFADWCGACIQLSPHYERLSSTFKESTTFLKVNIDDCPGISETYRISRLPTFVFLLDGLEVDRCGGSADALSEKIAQWSSQSSSSKNPLSMISNIISGETSTSVNEKEFKGAGNRLGDKPHLTGKGGESTGQGQVGKGGWFSSWFSSTDEKPKEVLAQEKMGMKLDLPHAPIQIRLVDSTRLQLLLNLNQPVTKIREFIIAARPEYTSKRFTLMHSYPHQEISDEKISIEEAQLGHSIVIQKLAK